MSKFVDKLQRLSRSSSTPIGFRPSAPESESPRMLLIAGLSGTQAKEAKMVADVDADAGLILNEDVSAKTVRQMAQAVGNVPLGVLVKGMSQERANELADLGCDFVVFGINAAAAALHKEEVGKVLMIEPTLDLGLVRAVNSLGVDGVFVNPGGDSSFVAVEHLLVCRRLVDLLEKPVMMALPSLVTKSELTSMWQAGVDAVVTPPSQSAQALTELKEMIGDLPRRARGHRAKADVILPRYGEGLAGEEDEEGEEI